MSTGCDAAGASWDGGEMVFEVSVPTPGELSVELLAGDGVQVFLLDRSDDDACVSAGTATDIEVHPGAYWLLVDADSVATAPRLFTLNVDFSTDFVADDPYEHNAPYEATGYYVELFDEHTVRATLTPQSRLDWYELQVHARAAFRLSTDAPVLHIENDDEEPLDVVAHDDGTWSFEDWVHNRDRTYWVRIDLPEDAPDDAWADYTLSFETPETNRDAWD